RKEGDGTRMTRISARIPADQDTSYPRRSALNSASSACHSPHMTHEPTVFDELFALLTPDRLLRDPRATGAGVSVAVIDSGVERAVLTDKFGPGLLPIEGVVFRPGAVTPSPYDGRQ